MKILIRPDAAAVCGLAARILDDQLRRDPGGVLGLATGRTTERIYAALLAIHAIRPLDLSRFASFNLDEYVGLPPEDPRSYRAFMARHLARPLDLPPGRVRLPDGMAADPDEEGARYERRIAEAGGIELQLLGLGATGHIGFNEPLSAFRSRTRAVTLAPLTRRQNAAMFGGDPAAVPARAITMGIATILEARRILLVVTGASKAAILAQAIEGPLTAMISGSALQAHADCLVLTDEAAAGRLAQRAYYDELARGDPELVALLRLGSA